MTQGPQKEFREKKRRTIRKRLGPVYPIYKLGRMAAGHALKAAKVKEILATATGPIKLHAGAGENYKEGWVNIDLHPATDKEILHNLVKGIPFPDNSVDFIYTEHFIEHIPYDAALAFMTESYRVLKPGGVLRISCPDLDFLVAAYTQENWRTHSKEEERPPEWEKILETQSWYPNRCFMFNLTMRENGEHKYIYNFEEMAARLNEAGFFLHHIHDKKLNQSDYPELQNIDWRGDSLIVEAVKDRSFQKEPLLTVIVPAYDSEDIIAETLDSILAQKTDFKFIVKVAADYARDKTQKIVRDYQEKHPDIIKPLMSGFRMGTEKTLHRALRTVDTEYLAFLEAGDTWRDPLKLQTQVDALKANPDCTVSAHNTDVNKSSGKKKDFIAAGKAKARYAAGEEAVAAHPSALVCRNVLQFSLLPFYLADKAGLQALYQAEGGMLYEDKVMSVHNAAHKSRSATPPLKKAVFSALSKRYKRKLT